MLLGRAAKGSDQPLLRPMGAWLFLTMFSLKQLPGFIYDLFPTGSETFCRSLGCLARAVHF